MGLSMQMSQAGVWGIYTNQPLVNPQSMFNSAAGYCASMVQIQKHWYGAT